MVLTSTGTSMEGYCVKEKMKVNFIPDPQIKEIDTKRGKKFSRTGVCPNCGTKLNVFVKGP